MKQWYIDLACFQVEAPTKDEAYKKAFDLIQDGKILIEIVNVEKV